MDIKILNKEIRLVEDRLVIVEEVEKVVDLGDLLYTKENIRKQKMNLLEQSEKLNAQFNELVETESEMDQMIRLLLDKDASNDSLETTQ